MAVPLGAQPIDIDVEICISVTIGIRVPSERRATYWRQCHRAIQAPIHTAIISPQSRCSSRNYLGHD